MLRDKKRISGKKVLVTGADGFIGSNLVEDLLNNDNQVIGLDNFSTGFKENISAFLINSNFTFIEGDIRDLNTCLSACKDVDIVLHQAALGSVPRSIKDPLTTNAVNIDGFLNMLVASRDSGVKRFVFASSSSVYGDSVTLPKVEDRIGEPLSPYATTKLVNEKYAKIFQELYGLETIGLRYFNVFGPKQSSSGEYAAVIPKFVEALLRNEAPIIYGDGTNFRDFTFIENVIQMNNLSATTENKLAIGEIFNTATGYTISLLDLFSQIKKIISEVHPEVLRITAQHGPTRGGDILHSWANIENAKIKLAYQPSMNFNECLKKTIPFYNK